LLEGAALVRGAAERADDADRAWLLDEAKALAGSGPAAGRAARALAPELATRVARNPDRSRESRYDRVLRLEVDRERAAFGASNPPKKCEDIDPLDFGSADWRALWDDILRVVLIWVERGVRIFRVDNPHTKPFAFWEWLIREVRTRHPDVFFLAEAFTRPKVM